jgi:hypothetical protein
MNVEFNENKAVNYNYPPKSGGITGLVIKMKLAKDEKGAQKVMIIIAVIFLALSVYFFLKV